jgi:hypothetical protein
LSGAATTQEHPVQDEQLGSQAAEHRDPPKPTTHPKEAITILAA